MKTQDGEEYGADNILMHQEEENQSINQKKKSLSKRSELPKDIKGIFGPFGSYDLGL